MNFADVLSRCVWIGKKRGGGGGGGVRIGVNNVWKLSLLCKLGINPILTVDTLIINRIRHQVGLITGMLNTKISLWSVPYVYFIPIG